MDFILIQTILKLLYSSFTLIVGGAVFLLWYLNERKGLVFSIVTLFFFIIGLSLHLLIKNFDDTSYVYRYIFWAFNDIAWMGLIAYLTIKDKIYIWQSILGQLIVLPAPLLQLMRLVDRHYFDLSYTTYLYKTLLPIINMATVALCFAPLFVIFSQYLKNKKSEEEVEV